MALSGVQDERGWTEVQEVVYAVSHDLNAPARHIAAFSHLLESSLGDRLDDEGRGYLAQVLDATDVLQAMLRSLTEYSRVVSRAEPFTPAGADAALAAAVDARRGRIAEHRAVLDIGPLPTVVADHEQLAAVFGHLLDNSLRFCDPGVTIGIRAERSERGHRFTVTDSGPGFRDDGQGAAFRLFKRFHPLSVAGNGVGLAVVERIVDRHGGTVELRSDPDGGTTVDVDIPVDPETGPVTEP